MEGVGLTAHWNNIGIPFVIPPFIPPLLLVTVTGEPPSIRIASLHSLPRLSQSRSPAEFNALDAAQAEKRVGEQTLNAVKPSSPTRRARRRPQSE